MNATELSTSIPTHKCESVDRDNGACQNDAEFFIVADCVCGEHGTSEVYANCKPHAARNLESIQRSGDKYEIYF